MNYCKECGEELEIVGVDVYGYDIYDCENRCNENYEDSKEFKEFVEFFI